MRTFINKYKYPLLLILVFVVAEAIVNPTGNFPLNDDWTYAKSVKILGQDGKLDIGNFAAMSLFTHILWGFLFVKTFWFSFTILRISTLVSSLIGVLVLNQLVLNISQNRKSAFLAALVLIFNPLYFNLSNTFMTDINFTTLLLLGVYFANDFFQRGSRNSFFLVFVFSALLVLVRQFGILLPLCFTFACLLRVEKRWLNFGLALVSTILVYGVFHYYEQYLRTILPVSASYKFSGNIHPGESIFWDTLLNNWNLRYRQILLHVFIYSFPFAFIFFPNLIRSTKPFVLILVSALGFITAYSLFKNEPFPTSNVFTNMSLGAETFYETLSYGVKDYQPHTHSGGFESVMIFVKFLFGGFSLTVFFLGCIRLLKTKSITFNRAVAPIFILSIVLGYVFLILITESYFDRYHLPLIVLTLLLFVFITKRNEVSVKLAIIPLLCFVYVSVFGTRDYLSLNRTRWQAYDYLTQKEQVAAEKINGGFEVNCWNEGKPTWWSDFLSIDNFDYLIQYRQPAGYRLYKEFEFQRYFPYKKDKVNIFVNEKQTEGEAN